MNSQTVDSMLRDYKKCEARAAYLVNELETLSRIKERQTAFMIENEINISPKLTGIPGSNGISDKVGDMAMRFASGYVPRYLTELGEDIERVKSELFEMEMVCSFVKGWLLVLTERERFVIEEHVIKGRYWSEIIGEYEERYGIFTKEGMRKIGKRALNKIYETAE